ncbi:MAG: hypothetical protein NTZ33_06705 [Bacteroidetes bacterium]|nr:hypothetical protein [Bacteroidota bacterium]
MKRITSYISCIVIIILFLASSTGISFVIHHCSNDHSEEIRFFAIDYQCAHEKITDDCAKDNYGQHHCDKHSNHHCCKNTRGYFRIADEYTVSKSDIKINIPVFVNTAVVVSPASIHSDFFTYNNICSQHPSSSGVSIYCMNSQFLI